MQYDSSITQCTMAWWWNMRRKTILLLLMFASFPEFRFPAGNRKKWNVAIRKWSWKIFPNDFIVSLEIFNHGRKLRMLEKLIECWKLSIKSRLQVTWIILVISWLIKTLVYIFVFPGYIFDAFWWIWKRKLP